MKRIYLSLLFFVIFGLSSCHKDLVEVNLNDPDTEDVLSEPEGVYLLAEGSFFNWYMTVTSSISPRMAMWVMADNGSCSWANSGMFHLSSEPRAPFDNSTSYTYAYIFEAYYADLYGTLQMVNNVLRSIEDGMEFGEDGKDTKMLQSFSYFIQGASLGYLGLVYDQAFIVTDDLTIEEIALLPPSPYADVMKASIESLDKAIEIARNNNFTIPENWINGSEYSSTEVAELASGFAARFLVHGSRNATENSQVNWSKVKDYANNAMKRDLAPYMDNVKWKSWFRYYTVRPGWARIDARVINLMDDRYPWRFPDDGISPPPAQGDDNRLQSDFSFNSVNNMKPERGYYHFSNYEYTRYPYSISTHTGEVVEFSVAEIDLFRAEAYAMMGDLGQAIQILNEGTRTTRGGLSPLNASSSKEKVLEAIFYERDIELIQTGFGIAFFDMRRRDMLQTGTMLHFPIPAKELMVMQMPIYTFGGVNNADGENTSNGGWFPTK